MPVLNLVLYLVVLKRSACQSWFLLYNAVLRGSFLPPEQR